MSDFDTSSDRAFRFDLERFLQREVDADVRAQMEDMRVKEYVKEFTQPGEEYDPWSFSHFEEAIENAPEAHQRWLWILVTKAADRNFTDFEHNHDVATAVVTIVEAYWLKLAYHDATKRLKQTWDF